MAGREGNHGETICELDVLISVGDPIWEPNPLPVVEYG